MIAKIPSGGIFLETKPTLLKELDQQFLASHHSASKTALADVNHVVIYHNNELALWKNQPAQFELVTQQLMIRSGDSYTTLKTVAHLPFHIRNLAANTTELEKLKVTLAALTSQIENTQAQPQQKTILRNSAQLITETLKLSSLQQRIKLIDQAIQDVKTALDENCKQAVNSHSENFKTILNSWMQNYALELAKTRVVITGTHGPKDGLIETDIFAQWYEQLAQIKEPKNKMIYYSESLPQHLNLINPRKDLIENFLAKAELNKSLGKSFNGDEKTMFQDIRARYYLPTLLQGFFKKPTSCPYQKVKKYLFQSPKMI